MRGKKMKTEKTHNNSRACRRHICAALVVAAITSAPFAGAWAVEFKKTAETMHGVNTEAALQITTEDHVEKALPASDRCLSLLKTVNHVNGPVPAMPDRRYDASKAAALGVVFGVKFALGPKEVTHNKRSNRRSPKARFSAWQLDNQSAAGGYKVLAVADYRRCRNEQALNFLSDWRWSR